MPHLGFAGIGVAIDQIVGGHDHAGRAEAALQTVLVPERLLQWMQLPVGGKTFDRHHGRPVGLNGEDRAGLDRLPIDEDRTRAALAGVAADVGAGKAEVVAEKVNEEEAGLDLRVLLRAVDGEGNGMLHVNLRRVGGDGWVEERRRTYSRGRGVSMMEVTTALGLANRRCCSSNSSLSRVSQHALGGSHRIYNV